MPAKLIQEKFVSALPGTLVANTLYYVRVGTGFDVYLTNSSGTIVAYPLNKSVEPFALTDGSTITIDAAKSTQFAVTLGGNRTIAAPSNPANGRVMLLWLTQDATGNRTLTWNATFRFPAGTAPTLSTGAGKTDYVAFVYNGNFSKWDFQGISAGL